MKQLNLKNGQKTIKAALFTLAYEPKQRGSFVQEKRKQVLHRLVYFNASNGTSETESYCLDWSTASWDGHATAAKDLVFYFYLLNFCDHLFSDEISTQISESVEYITERRKVVFI